MSEDANIGSYIWRGGNKIKISKIPDNFTIIVRNNQDVEFIRSMPGISEVKQVQKGICKVKVSSEKIDEDMAKYRSKEVGGICHHMYCKEDSPETEFMITDQIIVKFKPETSKENIEKILADEGIHIIREIDSSCFLVLVTSNAGKNPIKVSNLLAQRDEVSYAEPNLVNQLKLSHIPSDTHFDRQWHLKSWDGPELVDDADVSVTEAWDITRGNRSIVVSIVDDGFDLNHHDFQGEGKVVHARDYVDGDSRPFPETSNDDYHGTPVAGIAIAEEDGEGVVGVAPGCGFMPIRFPLSMSDIGLVDLFAYTGLHADVISCSWGPTPGFRPIPRILYDKFIELTSTGGPRKKGCVIIFAAGNDNSSIFDEGNNILNGFTHHPNIIAVAASTSENKKAVYSNWGEDISVCAPSNNFHPLNRNVRVRGRGIVTTDNEQLGSGFSPNSIYTDSFGGTSSATPLVAGIAALVISANKELTSAEVKQILEETADKIVDSEPDIMTGDRKGSYENGHSEWFGFGKVNAAKAVKKARELKRQTTGISSLKLDAEIDGNLRNTGDSKIYKITIGSNLLIKLEGPQNADFDIYLKRDSLPTVSDSDLQGITTSSNEIITVNDFQPGEYFVMVRSFRGAGDFKIKAEMMDNQ